MEGRQPHSSRILPSLEASDSCSPRARGGVSSAMFMSEPLGGSPRNRVVLQPVSGSETPSMPDREGTPETLCERSPRRFSTASTSTQASPMVSVDFQGDVREDAAPQRSASRQRWLMAKDALRNPAMRKLVTERPMDPSLKAEASSMAVQSYSSEANADNHLSPAHSVPVELADEAEVGASARRKSQAELDAEMMELLRAATPPSGLPPAQPRRGRGWQVLQHRAKTQDRLPTSSGEDELSVQHTKSERMDARMDRVLRWAVRSDNLEEDQKAKDDIDSCIDRVNRKVEKLRKTCDDNNIKNYED